MEQKTDRGQDASRVALGRVYQLLLARARGDGLVILHRVTPVRGADGMRAVGDLEVAGQRGLVAVREDGDE